MASTHLLLVLFVHGHLVGLQGPDGVLGALHAAALHMQPVHQLLHPHRHRSLQVIGGGLLAPWGTTICHNGKLKTCMDFYIIHGLILCLWPTLKKGQNLFGILVSSLQLTELNTFIIVFY